MFGLELTDVVIWGQLTGKFMAAALILLLPTTCARDGEANPAGSLKDRRPERT